MSESLEQRLLRHEGIKLRAYKDSLGILTIGVGRNIENVGISADEAMYLLQNDIDHVKDQVSQTFPWTSEVDNVRLDVIYEMTFQLGISGVKKFPKMLDAVKSKDYATAASEMLNSAWHTQTPARCEELANLILNGGQDA